MNRVKQHSVADVPDQDNFCKSFVQGDTSARPDSTTSVINGMLSSVHSRRKHLLQNMLSQGGLAMSLILQQPHVADKLDWLRKAFLPHGGLNLLTLLDCDLAGSHVIGRLDSPADFEMRIEEP